MRVDSDEFFGGMVAVIVAAVFTLIVVGVWTDEYGMASSTECVAHSTRSGDCVEKKTIYSCGVVNGETRMMCDTPEPCNAHCAELNKED